MKWELDAIEGIIVAGDNEGGRSLSQVGFPTGIFVDDLGAMYEVDAGNDRVVRWSIGADAGELVVGNIVAGQLANQLSRPDDLAFDQHGNLYVIDQGNA